MDRLCAIRCILPTHVYIYTSVHVYIAYDARTVAFIFGRERERGRGGGSGFGGFELCLSGARARLCVRACVFATRRRTSCVTADTRASTHGRENPAGAYAAGFCMRGGAGRGGSVVSSLLLFGTRYADLT